MPIKSEYLLDVAKAYLIENATGFECATGTLKSHTISQSVDTSDIRGGQGNELLSRIKSNKNVTITLEDVCHNRDFIAMAMGSEVKAQQNFETHTVAKDYVVGATATEITLDPAPKAGTTKIKYWAADGSQKEGTVSNSKLTIAGAKQGEVITVGSYLYTAKAGDLISIASSKFSGTYTLILEEPVIDLNLDVIAYKKSVFPRVQADDSFELVGGSERGEKTMSYTFTALKTPGVDELGYFYYEKATK